MSTLNHPCAEHHINAAAEHRLAADLHAKATILYQNGEHQAAAHFAHLAHGHSVQANEHANEAAKAHIVHHSA